MQTSPPHQPVDTSATNPVDALIQQPSGPLPTFVLESTPSQYEVAAFWILAAGFFITITQLTVLLWQHRQNHVWNRMKAAEDACNRFSDDVEFRRVLSHHLDLGKVTDPISHDDIMRIADELNAKDEVNKPGTQMLTYLHRLLNYYESFARGMDEGVYDKAIIKRALRGQMIGARKRFMLYIEERQKINDKVFEDLLNCIKRWEGEDANKKAKNRQTGR